MKVYKIRPVLVILSLHLIVLIPIGLADFNQKNKRLLLNDPDITSSRLNHLEQQNKALTQQTQTLTQQNQALSNLLSKLNATVMNMELRLQREIQEKVDIIPKFQGTTFIRWGRTVCTGTDTELVYRGYTAGQNYYHADTTKYHGGPSDYLCLPDDPQISNLSFTEIDSLLYGTEYERNYFAPNSADEDVPCTLCRKATATSIVMIPGRQTCYKGWNLEYNGFLGSGSTAFTASSYICVDSKPEYIPSGHSNMNGHLIYMVGYKCGPLPCPPYVEQRRVDCVVCSK